MLSTERSPVLPANAACAIISEVVAQLQKQHPNPLKISTCLLADLYFILLSINNNGISLIIISTAII